jgi:putative chitinase
MELDIQQVAGDNGPLPMDTEVDVTKKIQQPLYETQTEEQLGEAMWKQFTEASDTNSIKNTLDTKENRKAFVESNLGSFSGKTERAAFMAQVYQESKGKPISENLNYSSKAITSNFSTERLQGFKASELAKKPEDLANVIYGGEWGKKNLGNTQPGDGWKYRGRGLIQITGRANYEYFGKQLGIDLVNNPELALDPKNAYDIAEIYWRERVASKVDNFNDTEKITKLVNGGKHGLEDRKKWFSIYNK